MRSEHEPAAFLNGEPQRRQGFMDARIVGDDAIFEWNVEINADKDALTAKIEVIDGELAHVRNSCLAIGS
jgi:hypothetical protein